MIKFYYILESSAAALNFKRCSISIIQFWKLTLISHRTLAYTSTQVANISHNKKLYTTNLNKIFLIPSWNENLNNVTALKKSHVKKLLKVCLFAH